MVVKLRLITIFSDFLLLIAAYSFSYFLRVDFIFSTDLPFKPFLGTAFFSAFVFIITMLLLRGYHPQLRFMNLPHILKILVSSGTATAAFGITYYFVQKAYFSRLLLVYLFFFGFTTILLLHLFMEWLEKHLIIKGFGRIPVLLIGTNRGVESFVNALINNRSPYFPIGILDGYGTSKKELNGVPVLGKLNRLEEVIEEHNVQAIVQGDQIEQVINLVHFCKQRGLSYYLLPYLLGMVQERMKIEQLELPVMSLESPAEFKMLRRILG